MQFDDFDTEISPEELGAFYGYDDDYEPALQNDGQPDEYTEWQDVYGGDDWDHGQYDDPF